MQIHDSTKLKFFDEYGTPYASEEETQKNVRSPQWRIRNMYAIKPAKEGPAMKFVPTFLQNKYFDLKMDDVWVRRKIVVKARNTKISTATSVKFLDMAMWIPNFKVIVVGLTEDKTEELYQDMYLFMWENFPKCYEKYITPLKDSHLAGGHELVFASGGSITVVVEARGGSNNAVHCTELGKVAERDPEKANRFKTGALPTLRDENAFLTIESTGHGPDNLFHQMAMESQKATDRIAGGQQKYNKLDRILQFFPWWQDPMLQRSTEYLVNKDVEKYLVEVEAKSGVKLTDKQKWWYAWELAEEQFTTEDMHMEYPSLLEECFERSTEGRIYGEELHTLRTAQPPRIGEFTYDQRYPVHTAWDQGLDGTAIWFFQMVGNWINVIWYHEYSDNDLIEGINYLKSAVPWPASAYGIHAGPHDVKDRSYLNKEENAMVVATMRGVDFIETERPHEKKNGILAVRMIFPRLRFDAKNCALLLSRLEKYRMKGGRPVHDESSHAADAGQTMALYIHEFTGHRGPRFSGKAGMPQDYRSKAVR